MKNTIEHLPEARQKDLELVVRRIREKITNCEMIILFGSYARGDYVEYDSKIEFGVQTEYMSDYDILIVVSGEAGSVVDERLLELTDRFSGWHSTPMSFIAESIEDLNKFIKSGRYFYLDLIKEGILLFDSKKYVLSEVPETLQPKWIAKLAQEYYDGKIQRARGFCYLAECCMSRSDSSLASFNLHQATENFLHTVCLVFTLDKKKTHDLKVIFKRIRTICIEVCNVFPLNNEEDKRLFELLRRAYIEARYNDKFEVTKEDIAALQARILKLDEMVERECLKKLAFYKELAAREK